MPDTKLHKDFRILLLIFGFITLSVLTLTGCGKTKGSSPDQSTTNQPYITKTDFLLNTVVTINLYDKQDETILNGCFDLIRKYESICSAASETSELYALNHSTAPKKNDSYIISNDLADVISKGLYYGKLSGGLFDITIEPISSQWDFLSENPVVPDADKIKAALPLIDYRNVNLSGNEISFAKEGMAIDLGGIAKGYIADGVKSYLLENGVKSAMINLGGNVLCVGEKPDGSVFHVGIQKPFADRNETIAIMDIKDLSVVSSGVYERFFTVNDKLYHHILDPATGFPIENGLISVTIISNKSVDGDGLSTTCFALGLDKGLALIESIPDTYAAFITSDYKIYYSKGFKEAINVTEQTGQ